MNLEHSLEANQQIANITLFVHQEDPEDLIDTTSPFVEDIKIEQERAICKRFEVRLLAPCPTRFSEVLQRGRIFDLHYFPLEYQVSAVKRRINLTIIFSGESSK